MPAKAPPWTAEEEATHARILRAAEDLGITSAELARAAGTNMVQMGRWVARKARLPAAMIARMEARVHALATGGPLAPDPPQPATTASPHPEREESPSPLALASQVAPGPSAPPPAAAGDAAGKEARAAAGVKQAIALLEAIAGPADKDDLPPAKDLRTRSAREHTRAAIGTLVRTMVSARSESVRARAAIALLEFGWGKALQTTIDATPQPPATDSDLLAIFAKQVATAPGLGPTQTIEAERVPELAGPERASAEETRAPEVPAIPRARSARRDDDGEASEEVRGTEGQREHGAADRTGPAGEPAGRDA